MLNILDCIPSVYLFCIRGLLDATRINDRPKRLRKAFQIIAGWFHAHLRTPAVYILFVFNGKHAYAIF